MGKQVGVKTLAQSFKYPVQGLLKSVFRLNPLDCPINKIGNGYDSGTKRNFLTLDTIRKTAAIIVFMMMTNNNPYFP